MAGVFHLDVIEDEENHTPFEFDSEGVKWRVPHPRDLVVGQQLALDRGLRGDLQSAVVAVRDVAERWDVDAEEWVKDPVQSAALMLGVSAKKAGKLLAAWLGHAGLEPGESRASSR